ncbi:MAG: GNAT family N-acetyltransferase [Rhodobacteraceae bacterium]|jgi:ribosomal protein S18 acetylase RimI-like enzyme|nr:GNAT family N-acetyltransferase [Paracoccaceae bacterium]
MEQTLILRQAGADDATTLSDLLNDIIAIGGTTAHQTPFTVDRFRATYIDTPARISCAAAFDATGALGFQSLSWPAKGDYPVPDGWAVIGSFVRAGLQGRGIGQHLWAMTRDAARAAGVQAIDATIRADNVPGLRFYTGLGFTDWDVIRAKPLRDGTPVDRIRKVLRLD